MKKIECTCDKFVEGCANINGYIQYSVLHHMKPFDQKYQFEYCPWCGKKLKIEDV